MKLSEKVNEYAERENRTRDSIADELGMSRSSFFNKVKGSYEFSLSEAYALSRILGVTLDEFHVWRDKELLRRLGLRKASARAFRC